MCCTEVFQCVISTTHVWSPRSGETRSGETLAVILDDHRASSRVASRMTPTRLARAWRGTLVVASRRTRNKVVSITGGSTHPPRVMAASTCKPARSIHSSRFRSTPPDNDRPRCATRVHPARPEANPRPGGSPWPTALATGARPMMGVAMRRPMRTASAVAAAKLRAPGQSRFQGDRRTGASRRSRGAFPRQPWCMPMVQDRGAWINGHEVKR